MRKFTLKSLLAVAFLLLGGNVAMADSWSINFVGRVSQDKTPVTASSTETINVSGTILGTASYNNGTEVINLDSRLYLQGNDWLMRTGSNGISQSARGGRMFAVTGCTAGQIITIDASVVITAVSNVEAKYSDSNPYTFVVQADGTAAFSMAKNNYIHSILVEDAPDAQEFNYTVNQVCGTTSVFTKTGTDYENKTITVPYRRYNALDGVLYKKDATNKQYNYSFVLSSDNQVENIEYTATETTNVVFISEGEDIIGMNRCGGNNAAIRSSNSAAGYNNTSNVTITTLQPGKYKIHVGLFDATSSFGTVFVFLGGTEVVASFTTSVANLQELDSEEFTLTEETDIILQKVGGNNQGLDFIYIVKTGDAAVPVDVTIGSTGYATLYYGDRALEVPEGVKAFTYTMTGNTLKENTTYEAGDVIPAGEAVVLNGTAGNYTFNLGTATAEKDAQNVLKGSDVEATFNEAGHKYYMLSTNDAGEVGFYWYNDDGSAINCAAHKAYLDVNVTSAKNGYLIDGTEDPTAITAATAEENGTNVVYDLQGRRVMNPVKGLYIVNGKKVIK